MWMNVVTILVKTVGSAPIWWEVTDVIAVKDLRANTVIKVRHHFISAQFNLPIGNG